MSPETTPCSNASSSVRNSRVLTGSLEFLRWRKKSISMRAPEGMSHLCPNTSPRTLELELEMPFHRRPFAVDYAENDGVALRAVRHELMVAQDGVLLGTQARDRLAGCVV